MSKHKGKHSHGNGPSSHEEERQSHEASGASSSHFERTHEEGPEVEERNRMIEVAAYYRAERRGFAPGCEMDDWLAAEAEIDQTSGAQSG